MDKIYSIEKSGTDFYGACQYRFYSLYNGMRGAWSYNKNDAIKNGEAHQKIILLLHAYNHSLDSDSEKPAHVS